MNTSYHEPVLVREVVDYLITSPDGVYVDATTGGGGHTRAILENVSANARIICFDRDADAIKEAGRKLHQWQSQITFVQDVFSNITSRLKERSIDFIDGVLFDLGVSSFQINNASRGFTFQQDAVLDMRMDVRSGMTGSDVLQTYDEKALADVFYNFGEERKSRQIARRIVAERKTRTIKTSADLAEIIRSVVGERNLTKSLARIFQALRIEVNAELDHLSQALTQMTPILQKGGRLVVISYHSLEDRIVKNFMKEQAVTRIKTDDPLARHDIEVDPQFRILTKKPVQPAADELLKNPRSRSAKLRVAERC